MILSNLYEQGEGSYKDTNLRLAEQMAEKLAWGGELTVFTALDSNFYV